MSLEDIGGQIAVQFEHDAYEKIVQLIGVLDEGNERRETALTRRCH